MIFTSPTPKSLYLYGGTGCGKTYTMSNILKGLANKMCNKYVELIFCVLHGKRCYDLFDNRKEIKLLSTSDGEVIMKNSKVHKIYIDNESTFIGAIEEALKLRTFVPTERNPISFCFDCIVIIASNKYRIIGPTPNVRVPVRSMVQKFYKND